MEKNHVLFFLITSIVSLVDSYEPGCNVLGCFSNEGILRYGEDGIVNSTYYAQSPEDIDITFSLFTSKNLYKSIDFKYNLERSQLESSPFDAQKKVKFIVHGWQTSLAKSNWMKRMKDLILQSKPDEYNVFAVDWEKASETSVSDYDRSCVDSQVVGAALAYFINKLHEFSGLKFEDIHLIGHSLGAHVAGFAGKRIQKPKIGRITGLDPAGPNFYAKSPSQRLHASDASYVDSLHTFAVDESKGLGISDPLSHIDFYPNGGEKQPCETYLTAVPEKDKPRMTQFMVDVACLCYHSFAYDMMLRPDKLTEDCQYVGYQCSNYDDFLKGRCTDCGIDGKKCAIITIFGEDDKNSGHAFGKQRQSQSIDSDFKKYYFNAIGGPSFCLHHYGIEIHLAKDSESADGKFTLDLEGSKNNAGGIQSSKQVESYEPGKIHTLLVTHESSLGPLKKAVIKWNLDGTDRSNADKSKAKIIIDRLVVKYMSNIDQRIRNEESSVMCPEKMDENSDGTEINFIPCCDGQDGPEGCRIGLLHQTPSMHVDDHHNEL